MRNAVESTVARTLNKMTGGPRSTLSGANPGQILHQRQY